MTFLSKTLVEELPDEIWDIIIDYLNLEDVKNLHLLNKVFYRCCKRYKRWHNYNYENIKLLDYLDNVKIYNDTLVSPKFYFIGNKNLLKNKIIDIKINAVDFTDFDIIKYNKNLQKLYLETDYNYYFKESFKETKKLKTLTFFRCKAIDDSIIEYINNNKNIKELNIYDCKKIDKIGGLKLDKLVKFSYTNKLWVETYNIIEFLKKHKNIKILNLYNTYLNVEILSHLPDLTELYISSCCTIFANKELDMVAKRCKNLVKLDISNLSIMDDDIENLVKNCKKLKYLNISENFIGDMSLVYISHYLPLLENLTCSFTYISRIGVENLLLRCNKLKSLNILNSYFSIEYLDKVNNIIKKRNEKNLP